MLPGEVPSGQAKKIPLLTEAGLFARLQLRLIASMRRFHHALGTPPFFLHPLSKPLLFLPDILQRASQCPVQGAGGPNSLHLACFDINFANVGSFAPDPVIIRAMRLTVLAAASRLAAADKLRADFSFKRLKSLMITGFLFRFGEYFHSLSCLVVFSSRFLALRHAFFLLSLYPLMPRPRHGLKRRLQLFSLRCVRESAARCIFGKSA